MYTYIVRWYLCPVPYIIPRFIAVLSVSGYLHTWTCSLYSSLFTRVHLFASYVASSPVNLPVCLPVDSSQILLYQLSSCTVRDVHLISRSRTITLSSSTVRFHVRARDILGSSRPRPLVPLRFSILFHYSPSLWSLRYNKD